MTDYLIDTGTLDFTSQTSSRVSLSSSHASIPVVVAYAVDSAGNDESGINVFITGLSLNDAFIRTSESFTGTIYYRAISPLP